MKEIIITSSVLILCIMLIRIIFKGKISSRLQYALWLLVALRLVIPVSVQIYMAIGSVDEFRIMDLTRMAESKVGDVTAQLEQPIHFTMSMNGTAGKLAAKYLLETNSDSLGSPDGPTSVFYAGKIGFTWLDILRGIWTGGMVIMALWMVAGNIVFARRLHKERRKFVLPEPEEGHSPQDKDLFETEDDKWSKLIHSTKIYTVERLASPCLYGIPFMEAVYLTTEITEDADRLRHVLTHEMCHKKHCDSLWSVLRSILLVIYWINPLVWAAAVLSKRDCELACDEEALLILGEEERISYGETLLSIITRKGKLSDIACTATTMTGSGKSIKERIRFIAEKPHVLRAAAVAALALVIIVSVLVFTKSPLFHGKPLEGEAVLTAGDMQITLPETIAGISGYAADEDGDIVIYQVSSGEEVGRFCEMSYGEAVLLLEQGREVVPLGDYGYNVHLEEFMRSFYSPVEESVHYYTPYDATIHNYNAPDGSVKEAGMLYHEEYYEEPEEQDESESEGVRGTDSNSEDTTYFLGDEAVNPSIIVGNDGPYFTEEDILSGTYSGGKYYIPAPQKTDWEVIPLSEEELEKEINRVEEAIASLEEELARQTEPEAERERIEQETDFEKEIKRMEEELEDLKRKLEEEKLRDKTYEGVVAQEDMYNPEGAAGSDVTDDDTIYIEDDTTYVIEDENISSSQSVREEIYYPTEEIEGGESVDYLPNEEIVVTARPTGTSTKCYVYVKADYANVENQYLSELDYINSELMAVTDQVIVTE